MNERLRGNLNFDLNGDGSNAEQGGNNVAGENPEPVNNNVTNENPEQNGNNTASEEQEPTIEPITPNFIFRDKVGEDANQGTDGYGNIDESILESSADDVAGNYDNEIVDGTDDEETDTASDGTVVEIVKDVEFPPDVAQPRGDRANRVNFIRATYEKFKQNPKAQEIVKDAIAILAIAAVAATVGVGGALYYKSAKDVANSVTAEEAVEETVEEETVEEEEEEEPPVGASELEKKVESITGNERIDQEIDKTFQQNQDVGMWDTDGKPSKNALANPNALAKEYYGKKDFQDCSLDEKVVLLKATVFKTAPLATYLFENYKGTDLSEANWAAAVAKFSNASQEIKNDAFDKLLEVFNKEGVKWGETFVGDLRKKVGELGEDESYADKHLYMRRDNGTAETLPIDTDDMEKVLTFTYENEYDEEETLYFLEKCFNAFVIKKVVDKKTHKEKIVITVYEKDEDEKKDPDNLKRINDNNNNDIEEQTGDPVIDEQLPANPDEKTDEPVIENPPYTPQENPQENPENPENPQENPENPQETPTPPGGVPDNPDAQNNSDNNENKDLPTDVNDPDVQSEIDGILNGEGQITGDTTGGDTTGGDTTGNN